MKKFLKQYPKLIHIESGDIIELMEDIPLLNLVVNDQAKVTDIYDDEHVYCTFTRHTKSKIRNVILHISKIKKVLP